MPATSFSGYFAVMQLMIVGPSLEAQLPVPPPPPGVGLGEGDGAGAAGVRNTCVALHPLVVSASAARTRQYMVALLARGELWKVVCPDPSFTLPAATRRPNDWSVATWNS